MRRADRLFQIVQLIRGRRLSTAALLAERLEVSARTIYRDVADLQHQGVPIEGEAGVGSRLGAGFDLPPLMFLAVRFVFVVFPAILFVPRPDAPPRTVLLVGLAMSLGQFSLLYLAIAMGMPAGLASLVLQAQVLFTVLLVPRILGHFVQALVRTGSPWAGCCGGAGPARRPPPPPTNSSPRARASMRCPRRFR